MSEDPLKLGLLDGEVIAEAVKKRGKKPDSEAALIRAETNARKEERLSQPKAPPPPPPPPPEPEVKVDRSDLLDKIGNYRERFPDLKSRNKISGKSTIEEMQDELHFYEKQLGSSNGNMSGNLFVASMAGIEHVTAHYFNPLNLDLSGLATVSRDNLAEVQPILDELVIKYGANMYMSPEMRLVTTIGTMLYTVQAANTGDPVTKQALEKVNASFKAPKTDL